MGLDGSNSNDDAAARAMTTARTAPDADRAPRTRRMMTTTTTTTKMELAVMKRRSRRRRYVIRPYGISQYPLAEEGQGPSPEKKKKKRGPTSTSPPPPPPKSQRRRPRRRRTNAPKGRLDGHRLREPTRAEIKAAHPDWSLSGVDRGSAALEGVGR